MQQSSDPRQALARRLRGLRLECWPGRAVTQRDLAAVLRVSPPLISSWESWHNQAVPSDERLYAYATFFATERSVSRQPFRLFEQAQLTPPERTRRDELLDELLTLRTAAIGGANPHPGDGIWRFPDDQVITIVGSELGQHRRIPDNDPDSPDHVELYRFADLDALIELYGHVRAVNPHSQVAIRTAGELTPDDLTSHLVLLGGVDWNEATAELMARLDLPVRQLVVEPRSRGYFEVTDGAQRRTFAPVLRADGGREVLVEDVAQFYHGASPFNVKRTVTICNGMYQRGTHGAVRALTDVRFRDRNGHYVRGRFGEAAFNIVFRVLIANGRVVTPDWTQPSFRLHEWPRA